MGTGSGLPPHLPKEGEADWRAQEGSKKHLGKMTLIAGCDDNSLWFPGLSAAPPALPAPVSPSHTFYSCRPFLSLPKGRSMLVLSLVPALQHRSPSVTYSKLTAPFPARLACGGKSIAFACMTHIHLSYNNTPSKALAIYDSYLY